MKIFRVLRAIVFVLLVLFPFVAEAEDEQFHLGAQLAVTAETLESETVVALNVVPVVFEWAFSDIVGVRAVSILNLQFAEDGPKLAHRGAGLVLPFYLLWEPPLETLYAGPDVGYTYNPRVEGSDLTTAGEVGIRWDLGSSWTLNLAAQLGATRFIGHDDDSWVQHLGLFPSIGHWW